MFLARERGWGDERLRRPRALAVFDALVRTSLRWCHFFFLLKLLLLAVLVTRARTHSLLAPGEEREREREAACSSSAGVLGCLLFLFCWCERHFLEARRRNLQKKQSQEGVAWSSNPYTKKEKTHPSSGFKMKKSQFWVSNLLIRPTKPRTLALDTALARKNKRTELRPETIRIAKSIVTLAIECFFSQTSPLERRGREEFLKKRKRSDSALSSLLVQGAFWWFKIHNEKI